MTPAYRWRRIATSLIVGAATPLWSIGCTSPATTDDGVVVTRCDHWGAAARAGIELNDRIVAYEAGGTRVALTSPLELDALEIEESPRSPISLVIVRDKALHTLVVRGGIWELETRPAGWTDPESDATTEERVGYLTRRATEAMAASRPREAAWWRATAGDVLLDSERYDDAHEAHEHARALLTDQRLKAMAFDLESRRFFDAGRFEESRAAQLEALAIRESMAPDGPGVASSLFWLARIAAREQDYQETEMLQRADEILARFDGGHELRAHVLSLRGTMAWGRRELDNAASNYTAGLELLESLSIETPQRASLLANLGLVADLRGEMGRAEKLFRASATMDEQLDPHSVDAGYTFNFLGIISKQKGDLETARIYYEKALKIFQQETPSSIETAGILNNLGNIATKQGDYATAERFHREALVIREELVPESLDHAASMHNLSTAIRKLGQTTEAEGLLIEVHRIYHARVPRSLDFSNLLTSLGELRFDQGQIEAASALHRQALELRRLLAPGRWEWAESLFRLGEIALVEGSTATAERLWREAIEGIEANRSRSEWTAREQSRFAAPFHRYYRELARLLVDDGRIEEAFELLESARARALRSLLASRRLAPPVDLPAELIDRRRQFEDDLDRLNARRTRIASNDLGATAAIDAQRDEIRQRLAEVDLEARELSPRTALEEPVPATLEAIQGALDPGTVLLSYSVAENGTDLFVLGPGEDADLEVHRLPIGDSELSDRIDIFRALIERGRGGDGVERAVIAQGSRLFKALLEPVEHHLESASRVLIAAEGPLLSLPFAALVRTTEPDVQWVAGWRPRPWSHPPDPSLSSATCPWIFGSRNRSSCSAIPASHSTMIELEPGD